MTGLNYEIEKLAAAAVLYYMFSQSYPSSDVTHTKQNFIDSNRIKHALRHSIHLIFVLLNIIYTREA